MRLKTLKVWLFLLPVIGFIGVVLFVQSNKNITELEEQHLRSVEAIRSDILLALPDYYSRVEGYILRKVFSEDPDTTLKNNTTKIAKYLEGFKPQIDSIRYGDLAYPTKESIYLEGEQIHVKNLTLSISPETVGNISSSAFEGKLLKEENQTQNTIVVSLRFDIEFLLRKQANNKVFDQFFITDQFGKVIFPESELGQELFKPRPSRQDSLGKISSGVYFEEVEYSGNQNRFYVAPIPLKQLQLYAVGATNQNHFLKVGLRLNFKLLSTLIFFLILLVASVPILGILNLGKGDNLTQNKVLQLGISLMGLTLIIGFALSFFKNQPDPVIPTINDQKIVKESLEKNLSKYNKYLFYWSIYPFYKLHYPQLNELILFDKIGMVQKIIFQKPDLNLDFPNQSSVDLRNRAYFIYFKDKEARLKGRFLDSHYSRGNGNLESVISQLNSKSEVSALTFELKSPEKLSSDYRYLLIKEDGTILHKSNKIISPISNLKEGINPESWMQIQTLLKTNQNASKGLSIEVPLYLIGNNYTGILSQLSVSQFDQPLWLVFLVNRNVSHVFSSLSSLEAISLLAIYFGLLMFTLFLQKFSKDFLTDSIFKTFFFDWLKPSKENLPTMLFLTEWYFIYGLILISIYYFSKLNHIQLACLLVYSSSLIAFINLATSARNDSYKNSFIPNFTYPTLAFSMILGILFVRQELMKLKIGLILFAITFFIYALWFLFIKNQKLKNLPNYPDRILPLFLISWFLVIGFIPGYLIQSKTQLFENQLWNESNYRLDPIPPQDFKNYEKARRSLMVSLTDTFDEKIKRFIAPNQQLFEAAWTGTSKNLKFDWNFINLLILVLILILFFTLLLYLQRTIFFHFQNKKAIHFDHSNNQLFLCGIDISLLDREIEKKLTNSKKEKYVIDFLVEPLGWEFELDDKKDIYLFKNYHCLADPKESIPLIEDLKKLHKKIWISSGKQWKDIFSKIQDPLDKIRFSETFSDFEFRSIPLSKIDQLNQKKAESEENLLEEIRKRKSFYTNLWTEMSFNEKLIAYTYAKEGFFNLNRKEVLMELAQKGIITQEKRGSSQEEEKIWKEWRLFSPVFRKYVLDHSTEEEKEAFKRYEKKNGNSNSIQISLISFVLICFALIGIFDKNFFSEAYTYLTGSLGLLGSLYALLDRGLGSLKFGKNSSNS